MNRQQLISEIKRSWNIVKAMGLDNVFSNPIPLEPSEIFRTLATSYKTTYEELYLIAMENGDYNFLLSDYSFFQFGIGTDDHVRFAYYPNPFLGASREVIAEIGEIQTYVTEGLTSVDELLHKISEVRQSQHPPLVRYENSPSQYVESIHPCSHFHIGHHGTNRWALSRTLTPTAFVLLILKNFYSETWHSISDCQIFGRSASLDEILISEKAKCRALGDDLFSPTERLLFAFG